MESIKKNRILSVDALRGISILLMFLSGQVPFYKNTLPSWMYHAQIPPPLHQFNPNLPGITWVDLVFPFFLFTMGIAIPLSLNNKISQQNSIIKLLFHSFTRYLGLIYFAIFIQHIKPYALSSEPNILIWGLSLFGFLLLFPIFGIFPVNTSKNIQLIIKFIGIGFGILFLILLNSLVGLNLSLNKSDIIIIVLANVSFFGSILWLFSRNNFLIKLGILGFLLAFRLSHTEIGWVSQIWNYSPIPWAYTFYYLQYLFVVIPGIIIGDLILSYNKNKPEVNNFENNKLLIAISTLMVIILPLSLICLKARFNVTLVIIFVIWVFIVYRVINKINSNFGSFIKTVIYYGIYFYTLGLLFEPYEGGIKKDHPTLSYYFITAGISIFSLVALTIIIDYFKQKKSLDLFIKNGQNPLIAYAGITNLLPPLLGITGVDYILNLMVINPWFGLLKGLTITLLLGFIVLYFTKLKIYLRT